ncbi:ethanolamine ammonia-lyase subunit EutC [Pseudomonas japonica]|uniref:ethanolamine ammonia-lyase subunit EutC n=1 Tax=Pseudomonas japonica TaxID=256466 RepID=UPI0015E3AB67|nr:ethanolamine ammonia-lyase subunit EutC [Pseudomonas japonica]MBA1288643.1 ethanolamine ammonia-lyase subunit EutC [Pseudomonas japonica]
MSDEPRTPAQADPWQALRSLTPARIALGRAGTSLPTSAQLDFQFAHAQARDAVHVPLDVAALTADLAAEGLQVLTAHSAASDRLVYLQRPDLGRQLDASSAASLDTLAATSGQGFDLAVVIADGLSSLAVQRHAVPMVGRIVALAKEEGWRLAPLVVVEQGRVAVADEVAQRLGARMVVNLIGERPGLSSPDSLGLYFTFAPRVGLTDAARNCISNVRPQGLSYATAAHKLAYLMREACKRQLSGVSLKDEAEVPVVGTSTDPGPGNFLLAPTRPDGP